MSIRGWPTIVLDAALTTPPPPADTELQRGSQLVMQIRQSEQTYGRLPALAMGVAPSPPLIDGVILPAAGKGILDVVGDGKGVGPPKPGLDTEKLEWLENSLDEKV